MNVLESFIENLFGVSGDSAQPLHVGEVMALWTAITAVDGSLMLCRTMLNHTTDISLKETMEYLIVEIEEPQRKQLRTFMANAGIPMPFEPADKPKADPQDVPPGAKFEDADIANLLVIKLEGALQILHAAALQSIRSDVSRIFLAHYAQVLAAGVKLKKLMSQRGWLHVPPAYHASKPTRS